MARIEVPMPQMGESIAEGTVSKWLKQVGDEVERDEPILEISTDKVDAEIPAPQSGTLVEVSVEEGETVEVGTIVAYIDTEGGAPSEDGGGAGEGASADEAGDEEGAGDRDGAEAADGAEADEEQDDEAGAAPADATEPAADGDGAEASDEDGAKADDEDGARADDEDAAGKDTSARRASGEPESAEERLRTRSTPVVRKIADEHDVDLSKVEGTGHAGRVTKQDILSHIEEGGPEREKEEKAERKAPARKPAAAGAPSEAPSDFWEKFYGEVQHPEFPIRETDTVETMNKIRRLTAEHMVVAKRIAPHVHSFIEIDFSRIDRIRSENKAAWKEQGARVSYTAFVVWAASRVLREFPRVNGTVSGNNLVFRGNVNVGIAVDLDPGLIVPVIRDTDHLSLVGIGKKIVDLAERARSRQLAPDEIQGGTFSITNPGVLGTMVGMPVIPKGTSAILGTGAIEKKVVVVEDEETGTDAMAIRKRCIFSMGYDHRIVDGADAARFLARLKELLESFPEDA